jgi:hypothetical protein
MNMRKTEWFGGTVREGYADRNDESKERID